MDLCRSKLAEPLELIPSVTLLCLVLSLKIQPCLKASLSIVTTLFSVTGRVSTFSWCSFLSISSALAVINFYIFLSMSSLTPKGVPRLTRLSCLLGIIPHFGHLLTTRNNLALPLAHERFCCTSVSSSEIVDAIKRT